MRNFEFEKYLSYGLLLIRRRLVYKIDTLTMMTLQIVGPLVMLFVWGAIYLATGSSSIENFTFPQITSYFFVVSALAAISPGTSWGIISDVKVGNVFMYLSKPLSYLKILIAGTLANLLFDALAVGIPILLLTYFLLHVSLGLLSLALFVLGIMISFTIGLLMELLLGYLAFFIIEVSGIVNVSYYALDFFGGALVPLNLFPGWVSSVASVLPFQFVFYYPSAIFTNTITTSQAIALLPLAAFWIVIMSIGTMLIVRAAKKHMDVVGI